MKTSSLLHVGSAALSLLMFSLPMPAGAANKPAAEPADAAITGESKPHSKSMDNVKKIVAACQQWASKHEGKFPDQLEDLLTPEYLGPQGADVLHCPLLHNDKLPGYIYMGKGYRTNGKPETIVVVSNWQDAENKRIVGRGNGAVSLEGVKMNLGGWMRKGEGTTGGTTQPPAK
jgi:hypothetical protein